MLLTGLLVATISLAVADTCTEKIGREPSLADVRNSRNWESDRLISAVILLEQRYRTTCPTEAERLASTLKTSYLVKLDAVPKKDTDRDLFFRAFLVPKIEFERLRPRLKTMKPRSPSDLLPIFGAVKSVRGVIVLGVKDIEPVAKLVEILCGPEDPCGFWNRNSIFRVMITKNDGVAAYIPEIATLVFSRSLLRAPNRLHQFVIAHELAHVWIRDRLLKGTESVSEFASLSGWSKSGEKWQPPVTKRLGPRIDTLTALSVDSRFSLLPDGVLEVPSGLDGFVTERALRESAARNDPSEDLADHVAAFFTAPERYCVQGRAIAPRKLDWLRRNLKRSVLDCSLTVEGAN